MLSLMVDVYSSYLVCNMTNTSGTFTKEWSSHVLQSEAKAGHKRVVAHLITDSARYFKHNNQLAQFNEERGIIHLFSPPYTQSLNGLAERSIYTVVEKARTMLIGSGLPKRFYGEAIIYATYILNRLPHRAGAVLTRLERYTRKLQPTQRSRVHAFGCAAFVHLKHPTGPSVDKLDPKAEEYALVGYDEQQQAYRVVRVPFYQSRKINVSAHVTFVEDRFPALLTTSQTGEPDEWLPEDWADADPRQADEPDGARHRPRREWHPTGQALRNIAAEDADFPEAGFYFETVLTSQSTVVPPDVRTALQGEDKLKWAQAIAAEFESHRKHGTLGPAQSSPPADVKPIPFDVILRIKRDGRFKARGIIKGFHMQAGLHFNETFAPVPQISTFRTLLAVATQEDWEVKAGDVNTAFLEPRIDTLIWVKVPNYFNAKPSLSDSGFSFHQVLAGIPGIPQGPRLWYRRISPILSQCGLTQCRAEHTLYFDKLNKLYLLVWVDDLFFFFPTQAETQALKVWCKLQKDLDLDNWADISDCLGCKIVRDRPNRRMFLSQQDHAQKVLLKSCMSDSKHVDTPLASGAVLTQADSPDKSAHVTLEGERKWYLGILVSLLYLVAWTRPDLAYAVSKLCRFMHNPGQVHLTHLKRVLRYLKGTVHWGLKFDFSSTDYKSGVYGYFDAAHADSPHTRRTTMAYVFFLAGCPVSWHTKFHSFITTSTNHCLVDAVVCS